MKNLLFLFALILLVSPTQAQVADPDADGIGIYFEPCAMTNCVSRDVGEHVAWLVITHPTSPLGVGSWEARVSWEGPIIPTNWILFGGGIDFNSDPNEFVVGVTEPLVNNYTWPSVVVAEVHFLLFDTAFPAEFFIDGVFLHSLPERVPAYLDGGEYPNYTTIKELRQSTGGPEFPVATINGECAVASDETTWDGVKSMFR